MQVHQSEKQKKGEVELFVDPNQLSFVTVNLIKPSKGNFLMAKEIY